MVRDNTVCNWYDLCDMIHHGLQSINKPCQQEVLSSEALIAFGDLMNRKYRLPSASGIQMPCNDFHQHTWPHYWPNIFMKTTHDLDIVETARSLTIQQTNAHKGSWKSHIHPAEKGSHGHKWPVWTLQKDWCPASCWGFSLPPIHNDTLSVKPASGKLPPLMFLWRSVKNPGSTGALFYSLSQKNKARNPRGSQLSLLFQIYHVIWGSQPYKVLTSCWLNIAMVQTTHTVCF